MQTKSSRKNEIPDDLKQFDELPDTANVRLPVVKRLLGCSSATVWRMVVRGELHTCKIAKRVTGFSVGELRAILRSNNDEGKENVK